MRGVTQSSTSAVVDSSRLTFFVTSTVDAGSRLQPPQSVPNESPFPVEVARDLLALARALYKAFVEMGPAYDERRWRLRGVGSQLQLAIDRAAQGGPGTFPNRCAWLIAEKAARDLGEIVGGEMPAQALVKAAGERLAKKNKP